MVPKYWDHVYQEWMHIKKSKNPKKEDDIPSNSEGKSYWLVILHHFLVSQEEEEEEEAEEEEVEEEEEEEAFQLGGFLSFWILGFWIYSPHSSKQFCP